MENCNYELVNSDKHDAFSWKYLLRQILVSSVLVMFFFIYGMCYGAPTVFIPQMRREVNSTYEIDDFVASWIISTLAFATIIWCLILPIITTYLGRKLPFIVISIGFVEANFIFYFSTNIVHIFIYELLTGPVGGALTTIGVMVLTEYTSPRYRGVILTFKSATFFWGIWVANALGTFFHWKIIAITTLILSFYPVVIVLLWPESPYYLAGKERFDECIKSHKWLKGSGKVANEELKRLLVRQNKPKMNINNIFKTILSKSFYKPTLLCISVFLLFSFSGKLVCAAYAIDIIKKMTSSESTAYTGMLILDGVSVFSMYVGVALTHYLKRRTLFFSATSVGIISLFALSLYSYLVSLDIIADNKYLSIGLLSLYSMGVCCGPVILSTSLYGELLPLEHKSLCMCIVSCLEKCVMGIITKATPHFIKSLGLHAAFLGFGLLSSIFLIILCIYMPETKDKTLYEITDMMLDNNTRNKDDS